MGELPVTLEFAGGSELLFGERQRLHDVMLPSAPSGSDGRQGDQTFGDAPWTLRRLFAWIRDHLLANNAGNAEALIRDGTVRPGVLVLVNDVDWELLDRQDYVIKPRDKITFLSTLHGG